MKRPKYTVISIPHRDENGADWFVIESGSLNRGTTLGKLFSKEYPTREAAFAACRKLNSKGAKRAKS